MIDIIAISLLVPFAAIGVVTTGTILGNYSYKREVKRKEQFKRDVLEVLKEEQNAKV